MSRKFKLKDSERFKLLCKLFNGFDPLFQESCEGQWDVCKDCVYVSSFDDDDDRRFPAWEIALYKNDIEFVEVLDPYVWYPCKKFDGNPNNYVLVEDDETSSTNIDVYKYKESNKTLSYDATRFMYLDHKNKDK